MNAQERESSFILDYFTIIILHLYKLKGKHWDGTDNTEPAQSGMGCQASPPITIYDIVPFLYP